MRRIVVASDTLSVMSPGEVTLTRRESHYARNVLRLHKGDQVELLDGRGLVARGEIVALDPEGVTVFLREFGHANASESGLSITLMMGLPRGERWDQVVQKTTELGVHRLMPLYTESVEIKIPPERLAKRLERWNRIASEAARQCGRAQAPEILAPQTLAQGMRAVAEDVNIDVRLVAWEEARGKERALESILGPVSISHVAVLIGPEGGLRNAEIQLSKRHGFMVFGMGPRILRAETAAIVAVAMLQYRLGDLG